MLTAEAVESELDRLQQAAASSQSSGVASDSPEQSEEVPAGLKQLLSAHQNVATLLARGQHPHLEPLRGRVTAFNERMHAAYECVSAAQQQLQDTVHEARTVLDGARFTVEPTEVAARRLLTSSHRLAYSSFAPLLGEHLLNGGPHQPPCPSIFHMQLSQLSQAATQRQEQEQRQAAEAAAAAVDAARERAARRTQKARRVAKAPAALPAELPPMPKDWTPGDPIPGMEQLLRGAKALPVAAPAAAASAEQRAANAAGTAADTAVATTPAATAVAPPPVAAQPELTPPALDLDTGIDDDFVLNTEAIDFDSEDSSDVDTGAGTSAGGSMTTG